MKGFILTLSLLLTLSQSAFADDSGCHEFYKDKADSLRVEVRDLQKSGDISMYHAITFQSAIKGAVISSEDLMSPCSGLESDLRQIDLAILHAKRNNNK